MNNEHEIRQMLAVLGIAYCEAQYQYGQGWRVDQSEAQRIAKKIGILQDKLDKIEERKRNCI